MDPIKELPASGALGGASGGFVDGEGENRGEEEVRGFLSGGVGMGKDFVEGKDAETSETSGKADDGRRLGVAGANTGA
jgi:hypothetical protein